MKTKHFSRRLRRFGRANEAVSALEYAILVGIIAVAIAAALTTFSGSISSALSGNWYQHCRDDKCHFQMLMAEPRPSS